MTPSLPLNLPRFSVDVVEAAGSRASRNCQCVIGTHLRLSVNNLKAYFVAAWQPVVYDALLLAAAVEFCDRSKGRPAYGWGRHFELNLPVHDPGRWSTPEVLHSLHEALGFLTGDKWEISFCQRRASVPPPSQQVLPIGLADYTVIPFSDGMDSRAVAALTEKELGEQLIRVRLGPKRRDHLSHIKKTRQRLPFTTVPYYVRPVGRSFTESSGRSRGFKFFLASGLAAYLMRGRKVIIPESGQGALGPWLVPVGHAPEDCRNHPLFARRMERFLGALLNHQVSYTFPRLWFTKGETLKAYVDSLGDVADWQSTWSCWQSQRQVSVNGRKRQCGVCAACMLRRTSVHAAGLKEPAETYVWESLEASTFEGGAAASFDKITRKQREYAIAGALHLDHLAALLRSPHGQHFLAMRISQLSAALGQSQLEVGTQLRRLLSQHEIEWESFMREQGANSFLNEWTARP